MELTFRADGKEVAVVPFQYGRGIDSLPEIPAKKGFSAVWPDLDYTHLTASQTLDAVYTPYTSSLTDDTQTLPQILVDGSFSSRATVSHTSEPVSWTDAKGSARTGHRRYRHGGRSGYDRYLLHGPLPAPGGRQAL